MNYIIPQVCSYNRNSISLNLLLYISYLFFINKNRYQIKKSFFSPFLSIQKAIFIYEQTFHLSFVLNKVPKSSAICLNSLVLLNIPMQIYVKRFLLLFFFSSHVIHSDSKKESFWNFSIFCCCWKNLFKNAVGNFKIFYKLFKKQKKRRRSFYPLESCLIVIQFWINTWSLEI